MPRDSYPQTEHVPEESSSQSVEGKRTVMSVLSKGLDAELEDVQYLLDEIDGGRVGSSDLPLAARTCSVVLERERSAGNDLAAYESRVPREALKDFWATRLQRDLARIASLLDSKDLAEAYREMVPFFDFLNQAEQDGFDTTKIKEGFKEAVSRPLLRAFTGAEKELNADSLADLIGIYKLAADHQELFDYIGSNNIEYLQAIQKNLESKQR
ncbi:MAG: hypothetical protein HYV34_03235 [Candidatus Kerfeldbacteria bacterium]|nr:hypothetical protein [Candidatus Kerfeldbacteria bacterium]